MMRYSERFDVSLIISMRSLGGNCLPHPSAINSENYLNLVNSFSQGINYVAL